MYFKWLYVIFCYRENRYSFFSFFFVFFSAVEYSIGNWYETKGFAVKRVSMKMNLCVFRSFILYKKLSSIVFIKYTPCLKRIFFNLKSSLLAKDGLNLTCYKRLWKFAQISLKCGVNGVTKVQMISVVFFDLKRNLAHRCSIDLVQKFATINYWSS